MMPEDTPLDTDIQSAPDEQAVLGPWVAQLVAHLTLDFGSGSDLTVLELSPRSGSVPSRESA